jgi:hypothetical protein
MVIEQSRCDEVSSEIKLCEVSRLKEKFRIGKVRLELILLLILFIGSVIKPNSTIVNGTSVRNDCSHIFNVKVVFRNFIIYQTLKFIPLRARDKFCKV